MLTDVTEEMTVYQEEIFAPIISIIKFDDLDRALEMAADTPYGLSSYLFTHDARIIAKCIEAFETGEVLVNGAKGGYYLPHIGIKEIRIGCDGSKWSLAEYIYPEARSRLSRPTSLRPPKICSGSVTNVGIIHVSAGFLCLWYVQPWASPPLHPGIAVCCQHHHRGITPPFGGPLLYSNRISGASFDAVCKGIYPFLAAAVVAVVIITFFSA
jgi:hypothetical protein